MSDRVWLFDTTLRDGEQSPGYSMTLDEKLRMAAMLDDMGLDIIEAGFPAASRGDFEAVYKVSEQTQNAIVAGLCRAVQKDIEAVIEATKPATRKRIHTFISTSELHMKHKLQATPERVLELIHESVSFARNHCEDVEWSAEDATRTSHDYLCKAVETAIAAGASTVNIPDTVGYTVPEEYFALIKMLKDRVPNIDRAVISTHCHNDLGLAVANSLAGIRAGARQIECTINGIGERAGNASMEEIVMTCRTRQDVMPYETGIKTEMIMPASRLLTDITGFSVQPNKAVVGANAFAHESGIHQDGMLKNAQTYEIMTPESVGRDRSDLVLGKHSGRNAFRTKLQALGYNLDDAALNAAFDRFKDFADRKKKVSDDDLILIVTSKDGLPEERVEFISLGVKSGSYGPQEAELTVKIDGAKKTAKATGKGPVDACFKAMRVLVPHDAAMLSNYELRALTHGSDAKGEVNIRLTENGQNFNGTGIDTDVIVASCRAYIDALNRMLSARDAAPRKATAN
ncbi:MAG: 2-isopropylmalate synthase [Alphaproteobacteria bacterium]|nr:2-isopropylmalate synthase [Alphaproteobacteria bacterium]